MRNEFIKVLVILGFALTFFLSCTDNPTPDYPDIGYFISSSSRLSSSSSIPNSSSSSSSKPSSSSSVPSSSSSSAVPSSSSVAPSSSSLAATCGGKIYTESQFFCHNDVTYSFCKGNTQNYDPSLYECKNDSNGIYLKNKIPHGKTAQSTSAQSVYYNAVLIGSQTWIAANIKYGTGNGDRCGADDGSLQNGYGDCIDGKLYNWEAAKTNVCVIQNYNEWRLPTKEDWEKLIKYIEQENNCNNCAGKYLKSKTGWNSNGNGEDKYGFNAMPMGYGDMNDNKFKEAGNSGNWWSSSENVSGSSYLFKMEYMNNILSEKTGSKSDFYSVRCVKDN